MGKRRGITINIRDHENEALVDEVNALKDRVSNLEAEGNAHMATMAEVAAQMQDTVARVQAMGSVVEGVQTVVADLVRQVDALEPLVGNPDALMEGINAIRTSANAYQGTLAAAVAMGTSAENDPAPNVGPTPMAVPNQAARDAGIRDPQNVAAMQAAQGQPQPQAQDVPGAGVPQERLAAQNAPQAGGQVQATVPAQQRQAAPQPQQDANAGQAGDPNARASNPDAQPGQVNPPAEGFQPDTSQMPNQTEGQDAQQQGQQQAPVVRNEGEPQPARAAQRNDGTTR